MYVALTRAVHRCYLVIGPYETRIRKDECARSMLNWLVAGSGSSPGDWFDSKLSTQDLDAAWAAVAAASGGALVIDPLPTLPGVPLQRAARDAAALRTPAPPSNIGGGWRLSSYSGLSYGARSESAAGDHDARTIGRLAWALPGADLPLDDILRFPRGPDAGDCIHAVFETIDFTDRRGWAGAIAAALASHPQARASDPTSLSTVSLNRDPPRLPPATLHRMLLHLVEDVTAATLKPGLQLASVPMNRRLTELEFNLPVPNLSAASLNTTLKQLGYEVPSLTFGALEGYLKGFIDLVFEHQGQYFILDWKSNHLGYTAADYAGAPLARAMADHGYHLQYLLYVLALDRYLHLRILNYRYETHFGGVLYLFVRGVRPTWLKVGDAAPGVFFHRPAAATIHALNQLLGRPRAAALKR
jgi:exodeoxyribonuclease V beta subunit